MIQALCFHWWHHFFFHFGSLSTFFFTFYCARSSTWQLKPRENRSFFKPNDEPFQSPAGRQSIRIWDPPGEADKGLPVSLSVVNKEIQFQHVSTTRKRVADVLTWYFRKMILGPEMDGFQPFRRKKTHGESGELSRAIFPSGESPLWPSVPWIPPQRPLLRAGLSEKWSKDGLKKNPLILASYL